MFGEFAMPSSLIGRLPFGFGKWCVDLAIVMGHGEAWAGVEVGEFAEEHVEFHGAAFDGDSLNLCAPGWVGGWAQELESSARVGVRDYGCRDEPLAGFEDDAFAGKNLRYGDS